MFTADSSDRLIGTVQRFFSHKRLRANGEYTSQVFAIIAPYEDLGTEDKRHGLYRCYHPDAGRKLVYNTLANRTLVVPVTNIWSHVASQVQVVPGIQRECLMVQPLTRDYKIETDFIKISVYVEL
ncbi:hypothetical protein FA13DRAFT_1803087 [Coprinellus micaceus]|uniref:Uncharacterized protein n=1 Tax=Coprinellus micaceus TaxID=71717 RepID=A0A4Y7SBI5_COPMI|nr:hypothetical protein FA13DRAFT_1803087 [Coprinellus micaceus]